MVNMRIQELDVFYYEIMSQLKFEMSVKRSEQIQVLTVLPMLKRYMMNLE